MAGRPASSDPIGALADGTLYFAPLAEVVVAGDLVLCHLCGRWRRSVTAHLRAHGWTKEAYCEAFGLERGQSLEGAATRKLRATSFTARLVFDPAIRAGSELGRARARSGELATFAAAAARGRPIPEQRRRKVVAAMASAGHAASAEANRSRAERHLASVAASVAQEHGYPDLGALVRARVAEGASLAVISREAGLHKDWLSRHLDRLDPSAAAAVRDALAGPARTASADRRWLPVIGPLGFSDVGTFLRDRHGEKYRTVNQIAAEVGMSYQAVESALARHRLAKVTHAGKRHEAARRAERVAARLGYASVAAYVSHRRAAGWTWSAIAAESGQPPSWLRRHGGAELAG
jgi:hypothetical protein